MLAHRIEMMISEEQIKQQIQRLAQEINRDYASRKSELVLIGLLRGSFIFLADLTRQITLPHEIDFITASSYGNATSSAREVKIVKDIDSKIAGKDVLIIEDIIDTGFTLKKVCEILLLRNPKSLKLCTLLDKPVRREVKCMVDYIGFSIPDEFMVGYGIDYAQHYRNLPYLAKLVMTDQPSEIAQ